MLPQKPQFINHHTWYNIFIIIKYKPKKINIWKLPHQLTH